MIHVKSTTTVVRTAVARLGSTWATPNFANSAVAAANTADKRDHINQDIRISFRLLSVQRHARIVAPPFLIERKRDRPHGMPGPGRDGSAHADARAVRHRKSWQSFEPTALM